MTYVPTYRGSYKELDAEKDQANEWFNAQIMNLLTDKQRGEIYAYGPVDVHHAVDRQQSGPWGYSSRERDDYFHIWRMRNPRKPYTNMRFMIRKNGTLNTKNLKEAVIDQIHRRINHRRESNILQQNKNIWNELYRSDPEILICDKVLSSTQIGMCVIKIREFKWHFSVAKSMKITDAAKFIRWADKTRDELKAIFDEG